jgi:hypothetical protein
VSFGIVAETDIWQTFRSFVERWDKMRKTSSSDSSEIRSACAVFVLLSGGSVVSLESIRRFDMTVVGNDRTTSE